VAYGWVGGVASSGSSRGGLITGASAGWGGVRLPLSFCPAGVVTASFTGSFFSKLSISVFTVL